MQPDSDCPSFSPKVPAGHRRQEEELNEPTLFENLPAAQAVHVAAPAVSAKVPTLQGRQDELPGTELYLPLGQAWQACCRVCAPFIIP